MKIKFYPKLIFPTLKFVFIIGIIFFLAYIIKFFFEKANKDSDLIFGLLFFILFFGYFVFHLSYFFSFYFKYVEIDTKYISIFELNKLKTRKDNFNEIFGYSKSEAYFGNYTWKSKSIVIYYKNGDTTEILKVFISNFEKLEHELKRNRIKYLGFESYQTGWFFREYKFNKLLK